VISDRTRQATERLLCADGDPLEALSAIEADDADFARAQCIRIGAAVIAKLPSALPRIEQALAPLTGRRLAHVEALHVEAGAAWLHGDPLGAIERYSEIVVRDPRDLLALRLALSCCFFVGDHGRACVIADAALRASSRRQPGHGHALALASFAHAEVGDAAYAEWLGRASLELNPSCPLGVHAVAHALAESGDSGAGARWMREQRAQWSVKSRMRTHNAWHLAMFDLDDGRLDSAINILDQCLLPAGDRWPLDACDAVALLWRVARAGVDVGSRWQRLSDAYDGFWQPGFWPYVDLHAAVAHGEARESGRLRALEAGIAACALNGGYSGERAQRITQPALRALDAWLAGDGEGAARRLASLPGGLGEAGGSRAQIGVFAPPTPGAVPAGGRAPVQ
jgi:hypothetical protein